MREAIALNVTLRTGDTVKTTQLHIQCIGIDQDVPTQLRSEVAEPCVAQVSLVELSVVGDTVGTTQLHNQCLCDVSPSACEGCEC